MSEITRRRLLASAGVGAVGVGLGAGGYLVGRDTAEAAGGTGSVPFYGEHQAGIATPAQDRLHFAAFDLLDGSRADLRGMLREWSRAAAEMTAGGLIGDLNRKQLAPPEDTGETVGLLPSRLTVTIGFGPSLFERQSLGIGAQRPAALREIPPLPGDELDGESSGGDICVQACSDDPQVAFHAVRNLARIGRGTVAMRWSQLGFGRTASTSRSQETPRNLMGFKDGTANIRAEDTEAMRRHVWLGPGDGPAWMRGGSYMVTRRIRMLLEIWDRSALGDQEETIGRAKYSGAPLGQGDESSATRSASSSRSSAGSVRATRWASTSSTSAAPSSPCPRERAPAATSAKRCSAEPKLTASYSDFIARFLLGCPNSRSDIVQRSLAQMTRTPVRTALLGLGIGLVAVFAAGCGSSDSAPKGAKTMSFKLTDAGCVPNTAKAAAGPITFDVENAGTSKVTEFEVLDGDTILGEKENLSDGLSGNFSLTLEQGEYTLYCPGGSDERGTLTVSGKLKARNSAEVEAAVSHYRGYLESNTGELVAKTTPFVAAVVAGDVAEAKALYAAARIPYERIEPVAESFGDLDPRIDARANDVPAAEFEGFHRIEKALWVEGTTTGMAPVAKQLLADVEELRAKVKDVNLQAVQIANGANELLGEVSASKITGEEERYSHIDLVDFEGNVEGAEAAFEAVEPLLGEKVPKLAEEIEASFAKVYAALDPYRDGAGFVSYTELTKADTRALAQAIDTLAEQLSEVPAQIVD